MKKTFLSVLALILVLLIAGCASTQIGITQVTAPEWVDEPTPADEYLGIGFYKLQNESLARDLINMELPSASPNAQKRIPDGTWWVRVANKKAYLQKQFDDIFETEAFRYADFKKEKASSMLDSRITQSESRSTRLYDYISLNNLKNIKI